MKKVIQAEAVKMIPDLLKSNPQILKDIMVEMRAEVIKSQDDEKPEVKEQPIVTETVVEDAPGGPKLPPETSNKPKGIKPPVAPETPLKGTTK